MNRVPLGKLAAWLWAVLLISSAGVLEPSTCLAASAADTNESAKTGELAEVVVTARRREENLEKVPVSAIVLSGAELEKRGVETQSDLQSAAPGLIVRETNTRDEFNYAIRGQSIDASSTSAPAVITYVDEFHINAVTQSSLYDLSATQVLKGPQGTLFGRNSTGGAVLFSTTEPTTDKFSGYATVRFGNYGLNEYKGAVNLPINDQWAIRVAMDIDRRSGFVRNLLTGQDLDNDHFESGRVSILWQPSANLKNVTMLEADHSKGNGDVEESYYINSPGQIGPGPDHLALNATAATFYGPALNAILGPGAYAQLQASYKGLPAGGLVQYSQWQSHHPWETYQDAPLGHSADSQIIVNTTTYDISDDLQIKNIIGYGHQELRNLQDSDGSPFPLIPYGEFDRTGYTTSEEFQVSGKAFEDRLNFVSGLYVSREFTEQPTYFQVFNFGPVLNPLLAPILGKLPITAADSGNQFDTGVAIYGQGTYKLDDLIHGLSATGGFRYSEDHIRAEDHEPFGTFPAGVVRSQDNHKPSWTVGVEEQVTDAFMLYVANRGSWRTGGFNLNAPFFPGTAVQGGPAFLPETTHDVEVGAKFNDVVASIPVRANVALFQQWVGNIQRVAYVTLPTGLGALTYNVPGGAVFKGLEIDAQIEPIDGLLLGLTGAATTGKYGDPHQATLFGTFVDFDTIADLAKRSGSVFAEVTLPISQNVGHASVRGEVYAQSGTYFSNYALSVNPGAYLPGYGLVNFRVDLKDIAGTRFSVGGFVKNAFNHEYWVGGVGESAQLGFSSADPGEPRMFGGDVTYKF